MSTRKDELKFCVDLMIVESLLLNGEPIIKKADETGGIASQIIAKVSHYVMNNIDPNNKAGSLINMLAPGAISIFMGALGFKWLGFLTGLALRIFHIDVDSILKSIWGSLKGSLSNDKKMTSPQVDEMVEAAVQAHTTPATQEEMEEAAKQLQTTSVNWQEVRMLKLAMVDYEYHSIRKLALPAVADFAKRKTGVSSLLSKVIGLIIKVAIASAGLMVAGDVINKFLGRPNAIDDTVRSTQTKFKVQPSYQDVQHTGWSESIPNDENSISDLIVRYAKQVYQGLDGLDSEIRSSSIFQTIVERIVAYNSSTPGESLVVIPKSFSSKKDLVDMFIDEVAAKAK